MAAWELTCSRSPSALKFNGVELDKYATRAEANSAARWLYLETSRRRRAATSYTEAAEPSARPPFSCLFLRNA